MVTINSRQAEVEHKLIFMRESLEKTGAIALHLTGTDWFAWATAGASNTALLTAETGVAEILVTINRAWILTDQTEAQRLLEEELTGVEECYELQIIGSLTNEQRELHRQVREIEAAGLNQCQIGTPLDRVYNTFKHAYEQQGYPRAIYEHHQSGTAGYLAREIVANPTTSDRLTASMAIA